MTVSREGGSDEPRSGPDKNLAQLIEFARWILADTKIAILAMSFLVVTLGALVIAAVAVGPQLLAVLAVTGVLGGGIGGAAVALSRADVSVENADQQPSAGPAGP